MKNSWTALANRFISRRCFRIATIVMRYFASVVVVTLPVFLIYAWKYKAKNAKLILLSGFILLSTGCKDDDNEDNPHPPLSYFSCKVNGEDFETKGQPFGGCNGIEVTYYEEAQFGYEPGFLSFSGNYCPTPGKSVIVIGHEILIEETFDLTDTNMHGRYFDASLSDDSDKWTLREVLSGTLTINEIRPRDRDDPASRLGWIEGTFEFEVTNEARDTVVHVTEGKFGFRLQ